MSFVLLTLQYLNVEKEIYKPSKTGEIYLSSITIDRVKDAIHFGPLQDVVVEMASHSNWRVRQSVLNAISVMSFPSEVVGNLVSAMLKDEVRLKTIVVLQFVYGRLCLKAFAIRTRDNEVITLIYYIILQQNEKKVRILSFYFIVFLGVHFMNAFEREK